MNFIKKRRRKKGNNLEKYFYIYGASVLLDLYLISLAQEIVTEKYNHIISMLSLMF